MRISDWSSDVCSSDLKLGHEVAQHSLLGDARTGDDRLGHVHAPEDDAGRDGDQRGAPEEGEGALAGRDEDGAKPRHLIPAARSANGNSTIAAKPRCAPSPARNRPPTTLPPTTTPT